MYLHLREASVMVIKCMCNSKIIPSLFPLKSPNEEKCPLGVPWSIRFQQLICARRVADTCEILGSINSKICNHWIHWIIVMSSLDVVFAVVTEFVVITFSIWVFPAPVERKCKKRMKNFPVMVSTSEKVCVLECRSTSCVIHQLLDFWTTGPTEQ